MKHYRLRLSARYDLCLPADVYNMYGPTETTVWSTAYPFLPDQRFSRASFPSAAALANTLAYVLDPAA